MQIQTAIGALQRILGGTPNTPGGSFGELLDSKLMPDYYTLLKQGKVFASSILAANPTAFTGGAAGTPLIGLLNPPGSGVDLVLLEACVGVRSTGTAAAAVDFNHFGAIQGATPVTGVVIPPRNLYSMGASGGVGQPMLNVANTGAVASSLLRPSVSLGTVPITTAVQVVGLLRDEIKGEIVIAPGNYYAFGCAATLTAGSLDVGLIWAEIPV